MCVRLKQTQLEMKVRVPPSVHSLASDLPKRRASLKDIPRRPSLKALSAQMTVKRKDHLTEPAVAGDDRGTVIIGEGIVAELKDAASVKGTDRLAHRGGHIDPDMNISEPFDELLAQVHPGSTFIIAPNAIRALEAALWIVALAKVINLVIGRQRYHGRKGNTLDR